MSVMPFLPLDLGHHPVDHPRLEVSGMLADPTGSHRPGQLAYLRADSCLTRSGREQAACSGRGRSRQDQRGVKETSPLPCWTVRLAWNP